MFIDYGDVDVAKLPRANLKERLRRYYCCRPRANFRNVAPRRSGNDPRNNRPRRRRAEFVDDGSARTDTPLPSCFFLLVSSFSCCFSRPQAAIFKTNASFLVACSCKNQGAARHPSILNVIPSLLCDMRSLIMRSVVFDYTSTSYDGLLSMSTPQHNVEYTRDSRLPCVLFQDIVSCRVCI